MCFVKPKLFPGVLICRKPCPGCQRLELPEQAEQPAQAEQPPHGAPYGGRPNVGTM